MSDHIFKLINSLDRKEKAHFTKYAGMSRSDPKFLQLYQTINKMEVYEEDKLRKKFRQSFDSLKSDLQGKLLEALADFHKADSEISSVHYALVVLPVLLEKKLNHHFEQHLKKAKKQAENSENWSALYELLDWEKKYLRKSVNNKGLAEKFEAIYEKQNHCIATQQQEAYWQNLYLQLNTILRHDHRLRQSDNKKRFEALGNAPQIKEEELLSLKAKFYYHRSQNVYLRHTNRQEDALQHAHNVLLTLESKQNTSQVYVDALCSLSNAYEALERFDRHDEIMDKLKKLPKYQDTENIFVFEKACSTGLRYYLNTGQFEEARRLAEDMYNRWEQMKKEVQPFTQIWYCYNFIITHWILADYSKALFWMSIILDYKFTPEGKNYLMGARLLELMIYYDYKPAGLENRLDSIRRVLAEHWELSEYEKSVFTFFNQLIRKPKNEHLAVFQDFYDTLKPYAKVRLTTSNELSNWSKAKIEGKTLRQVIEQAN